MPGFRERGILGRGGGGGEDQPFREEWAESPLPPPSNKPSPVMCLIWITAEDDDAVFWN